jgi:hypothetical protein
VHVLLVDDDPTVRHVMARAIAYASLPGLSRVPLTLTLSRKRERGRGIATGSLLPRQGEKVRMRGGWGGPRHRPHPDPLPQAGEGTQR